MRILYHSAAPWVPTGYGTCTEEIAPRLHNRDHTVGIQTLATVKSKPIWWHGDELDYELDERMKIFPADGRFGLRGVGDHFGEFDADLLFTHFDTWMESARQVIPDLEVPYVSYVIVDHYPAPDAVVDQVSNAQLTIAMSEYAEYELQKKGIRPVVIPHGVDTDIYQPLEEEDEPDAIVVEDEAGRQSEISLHDTRLFGMVAANHGDRKNIPNHLEAFKRFLDEVDDSAILYIHTEQNANEGYNLNEVVQEIGIPQKNLIWASADNYGNIDNYELNDWYNAFDVLINVSMGESWGLAITEAMAAGTPAIVTNFSSMPEQLGVDVVSPESDIDWITDEKGDKTVGVAPHGIVIEPDTPIWREKVSSRQFIADPDSIFEGLKFYHNNPDLIEKHGELARKHVVENYGWKNSVIPRFKEILNAVESTIQ